MKNCVKRAIRWRPAEINDIVILKKVNDNVVNIAYKNNSKQYRFDHVFDSSTQSEVFDILVEPSIRKAIQGFNCVFVAMGHTGSGKTYTMGFEKTEDLENRGITPRVLSLLFSHQNAEKFKINISIVEVHNDLAYDLLSIDSKKPFYTKLQRLRKAVKKPVTNEHAFMTILSEAMDKRRIRETKSNSTSSRSHMIFTIHLRIQQEDNAVRESIINLVDLAGSECFSKVGHNGGDARVEGKHINESLEAFKRVLFATSKGLGHVPFRDSVLTSLLKDSLKTNAYVALLGCVGPYKENYSGTISTVQSIEASKSMIINPQANQIIQEKSKTPINAGICSVFKTPNTVRSIRTSFQRRLPMTTSSYNSTANNKSRVPLTEPHCNSSFTATMNVSTLKFRGTPMNSNRRKSTINYPERISRHSLNGNAKK